MGTFESKRRGTAKQALLGAARAEFAEHGLAGARVDRIAEAAGVNKERIYGLFGSKDKLFDAVLIDVMQEFTEVVDPLSAYGDAGKFVGKLYDYHHDRPELLRLLVWEALHRGADAHDIDGWRAEHYRRKLDRAMSKYETDDAFRAGMVTLALCGIANWVSLMPQLRRLMLGDEAENAEAIRAFLVEFAAGAGGAFKQQVRPVNTLTETDRVERAAERLREAQAEADAAKEELAAALRAANREGTSANQLAKQVQGTLSRPVVLKLLAS